MHPPLRWVSALVGSLVAVVVACGGDGGGSTTPVTPDGGLSDADAGTTPKPLVTLEGDLHFAGCTPAASAVKVRLRSVVGFSIAGSSGGKSLAGRVETAEVTATADPHVLHYKKDGLPRGDVFQLGADVADAACGTLAWRGPAHGLVVAGGTVPRIDGAAIKAHVEIRSTHVTGKEWLRADLVPTSELGTLQLRVVNDVPAAVEYELQVSFDRFPVTLDPGGACATSTVTPVTKKRFPVQAGAEATTMALDLIAATYIPGAVTMPARERVHRELAQRGAPIHIRAVPILAGGAACDAEDTGFFGDALVSIVPNVTVPVQLAASSMVVAGGSYTAPGAPDPRPLANTHVCYRAVADYTPPSDSPWTLDPITAAAASVEQAIARKLGEFYCLELYPDDQGWFDQMLDGFENFVGTVWSSLEWTVNAVARTYEEIKAKAVDIAAAAVTATTGLSCEGTCRDALTAGLEAGLCAMGMPPSLPDFDELVDKGIDYLAAEIARTTGVPAELTGKVLDLALESAKQAKQRRGTASLPWAVEDSGYHPPVLVFSLLRGNPGLTPPTRLALDAKAKMNPISAFTPFPGNGADSIDVPFVLQPNLNGLPDVPPVGFAVDAVLQQAIPIPGSPQHAEAWFQQKAMDRLAGACLPFTLWGGGGYPLFQPSEKEAELAIPNATGTFTGSNAQPCSP